VLLGVLFVLWMAWWISVLVVIARQTQTSPAISPSWRGLRRSVLVTSERNYQW